MSNLYTCQRILNRAHEGEKAASTAESGSRGGAAVAVGLLLAASLVGAADLEYSSSLPAWLWTTREVKRITEQSEEVRTLFLFFFCECRPIFVSSPGGLSPWASNGTDLLNQRALLNQKRLQRGTVNLSTPSLSRGITKHDCIKSVQGRARMKRTVLWKAELLANLTKKNRL